eukprot:TRINITY_DN237_c0_g1_i1.p1 TRINITY_DN237_c0_g1~~TRINITY_DN237_c0_g1_i1.p1  ORF type:complete len:524 (+),score=127.81 TRINITY_DN237_c0_g1_i1:282-1853(+)
MKMDWRVVGVLVLLIALPRGGVVASEEAAAEAAEEGVPEGPSSVLDLDSSNFAETLEAHDFIVVEFYAPWCGHCKSLAPEYEKAAAVLKNNDPPIVLAKVDGDEEKNKMLLQEQEVRGFPTLKIFRSKGLQSEEYKGPRDAEGIIAYLKKQAGPVSVELKSVEEAKAFTASSRVTIVGLFDKFEGDDYSRYIIAAEAVRADYVFAHTKDASHFPVDLKAPAVGLFKDFDDGFSSTNDFSLDKLTAFLEEESLPLLTEMNKDAAAHPFLLRFFNNPDSKIFFLLDYNLADSAEYKKIYSDLAKAGKGKGLRYLIADLEDSENALRFFGLEKEVTPVLIIHDTSDHKYIKEKVKPSEIAPWISDYLEGKLEVHVKSEAIPETNDEPVKVIVAKTLNETVLLSKKFVILEFYAPWCGHCKKLAPVLEEVAVHYKDAPEVLIAKYDATANDVPKELYEVDGFPTVYFHTPAGQLHVYDGGRAKEDIIAFIEKHRNPESASSHLESVTEPASDEAAKEVASEDVKDEL